jgi:hypothetical protein
MPTDQWRTHVQRWVDSEFVRRVRGDEILTLQPSDPRDAHPQADAITRSQESLSYCLFLLLLVSADLFLSPYWAAIGRAGHVTVALLVGSDALIVGASLITLWGAPARRLGGLLWLIATVAFATLTADVLWTGPREHPGLHLMVVGLTVLITSVLLWRNQNRPLQFLSAVTGFILTVCGIATAGRVHVSASGLALIVVLCALALAVAGLRTLRPAPTALVVAEIGCSVGSLALSFPHPLVGVVLGLVTTVVAVALGVVLVRPLLVVLGALGFFMFDIRAFSIYLRSSNSAIGAGVLGLIIVCAGLWHAVHTEVRERRELSTHEHATLDQKLLEPS